MVKEQKIDETKNEKEKEKRDDLSLGYRNGLWLDNVSKEYRSLLRCIQIRRTFIVRLQLKHNLKRDVEI